MARPAKFGAYTELYAGLDSSITQKDKWSKLIPRFRFVQTHR